MHTHVLTRALTHLLTDILTHVHRQLSHTLEKVSRSGKAHPEIPQRTSPDLRSELKGTLTASGNAAGSGPQLLVAWDPPPLNSPPHPQGHPPFPEPPTPMAAPTWRASSPPPITHLRAILRGSLHHGEGHLLSALETRF